MGAKEEAAKLSRHMRQILVAHVRENQPVDYTVGATEGLFRKACNGLLNRDLIRYDFPQSPRPKFTILTDLGREAVCYILGEYADGLVTAGVLDHPPIIQVRRRTAYSIVPVDEVEVYLPAKKSSSAPVS